MSYCDFHFWPRTIRTGSTAIERQTLMSGRRLIVNRRTTPFERSARMTVYRRARIKILKLAARYRRYPTTAKGG